MAVLGVVVGTGGGRVIVRWRLNGAAVGAVTPRTLPVTIYPPQPLSLSVSLSHSLSLSVSFSLSLSLSVC